MGEKGVCIKIRKNSKIVANSYYESINTYTSALK